MFDPEKYNNSNSEKYTNVHISTLTVDKKRFGGANKFIQKIGTEDTVSI